MRGHLTEIAEDLRTHLGLNEALLSSARLRIAAVDHIRAKCAWMRNWRPSASA